MTTTRELVFYTKPGCSLCDEAMLFVAPMAKKHGLSVRKVDISQNEGDETWYAHRYRIPVVDYAGSELGWGRIDKATFEIALENALRSDAQS